MDLLFEDNFDGTSLNSSYWNVSGSASVSGGTCNISGNKSYINTAGKVTFTGKSKYIIEYRARRDSDYGVEFDFVGPTGKFTVSDNNFVNWGFLLVVHAPYGDGTMHTGIQTGTTNWKEYRLTIGDGKVKVERGDTLASIDASFTMDLLSPFVDDSFYLYFYQDTTPNIHIDWVRVYGPSTIKPNFFPFF